MHTNPTPRFHTFCIDKRNGCTLVSSDFVSAIHSNHIFLVILSFFFLRITPYRHRRSQHTHNLPLWRHVCKLYPYEHRHKTALTDLEIDEVIVGVSLLTERRLPLKTQKSRKIRTPSLSQGLESGWVGFTIRNPKQLGMFHHKKPKPPNYPF